MFVLFQEGFLRLHGSMLAFQGVFSTSFLNYMFISSTQGSSLDPTLPLDTLGSSKVRISLVDILRWFWEAHDPTQGMGQGNDRGTQQLGIVTGDGRLQSGPLPVLSRLL